MQTHQGPINTAYLQRCESIQIGFAIFSAKCITIPNYAPEGQTIIEEFQLEVLRHVYDAVLRKRPDL